MDADPWKNVLGKDLKNSWVYLEYIYITDHKEGFPTIGQV